MTPLLLPPCSTCNGEGWITAAEHDGFPIEIQCPEPDCTAREVEEVEG